MAYPLTPITAFEGLDQPARDNPEQFADWGDNWVAAEADGAQQHTVLAGQVNVMAVAADTAAAAAEESAAAAAQSAIDATAQVALAEAAADAAALTSGAAPFNPLTSYPQYGAAISLVTLRTYRRRTAGTSATDPADDKVNWAPADACTEVISAAGPLIEGHYIFGADVPVTIPDLSTRKNFSLTMPSNIQAFTNNPVTPDGWTVNLGFSAGLTKTHAPLAFGSPHGWWGSLAMAPPILSTSAAVSVGTCEASVSLSPTLQIFVFSAGAAPTQAIAYNPTTDAWGAPVTLDPSTAQAGWLYAVSATSFVYISASGNATFAGSVSALAITLGAAQSHSNLPDRPVQLTASTYLLANISATNDLVVLSVSGTALSLGTAVTSGAANGESKRLAPISATAVLLTYANVNGAASQLAARVLTISGTTITLNAVSTSATSAINGSTGSARVLAAVNPGSAYIFCAQNASVAADGSWYGITVSGTAVTIGAVSVQTNVKPRFGPRKTHIYTFAQSATGVYDLVVNATTAIFASNTNGFVAASLSGAAITVGAHFAAGLGASPSLLTDVATGANIYGIGTGYSKLSISGVTITAIYTVAVTPIAVFSDTLTDKAVNYGGTWYSWAGLPAVFFPLSPSKYASTFSGTIRVYGSFS